MFVPIYLYTYKIITIFTRKEIINLAIHVLMNHLTAKYIAFFLVVVLFLLLCFVLFCFLEGVGAFVFSI